MIRLLNAKTLKLEEFDESLSIPPYLILSHTWGVEESEEVLFEDMTESGHRYLQKKAWERKVEPFCQKAIEHGFRHVWIDTCCIEKSDSEEFNESIDSMYRWYRKASACYVHLADVRKSKCLFGVHSKNRKKPVWFTRGWTLQELLAPQKVIFYDRDWKRLGSRESLAKEISGFTKIPTTALSGKDPHQFSVAERFTWAKGRKTKKTEDRVYSLLGLLGVSLKKDYGIGQRASLKRLKEIIEPDLPPDSSRNAVSDLADDLERRLRRANAEKIDSTTDRSSSESEDSLSDSEESLSDSNSEKENRPVRRRARHRDRGGYNLLQGWHGAYDGQPIPQYGPLSLSGPAQVFGPCQAFVTPQILCPPQGYNGYPQQWYDYSRLVVMPYLQF